VQEVSAELIRLCLEGDREALTKLVCHYQGRVFDVVGRMTPDRALAEDLAQEAFLHALRSLRLYRAERGPFSSWLFAILRNLLRDHHAREEVRRRGLRLLTHGAAQASGLPGAERRLLAQEACALLEREVGRLPEELRLALVLRVHQRLPYEEIARVLGVETGTAKSRVHRARAALREALAPLLGAAVEDGARSAEGRKT